MKKQSLLVIKGMCMGTADVIPGVSGGTMALILGIYPRLINAIKSFDLIWFKAVATLDIKTIMQRPHFGFLIPLVIGILLAVIIFTRVIPLPVLIKTHPEQVYGLFFGLILGSIMVLLKELDDFSMSSWLALSGGLVFGILVFNQVPHETPEASWFIFLSGAVAITAMILPGISGSFILLILNKYAYVLNAVGHFQFSVIIPFGLGIITGLMLFSRLLSYLLQRFYKNTLLAIVGMLIASLWVLWPFQERVYESLRGKQYLIRSTPLWPDALTITVVSALLLVIIGFIFVLIVNRLARHKIEPVPDE